MKNQKNKFLDKFINIASSEGVNESSLLKASKEAYGEERGYVLDFYNGLYDAVDALENYFDEQITELVYLSSIKSTTEKIRSCLQARIYADGNKKPIYQALSKFYLTPSGISLLAKNSWRTVDYIWKLAGDTSLDWNYYSKRSILFTIYTKNRRYFINSESDSANDLMQKIDIDLDRIKNFNKLKQKFKPENIPFVRLFIK